MRIIPNRIVVIMLLSLGAFPAGPMLSARNARGTALQELASSLQPGQWAELPTLGFNNGSVLIPGGGGGGGILEYCDEAQWNPVTREAFVIGTQRPYGPANQGWARYAEATNSWTAMPALPFYLGYHSYDGAALDPASGDYFYVTSGECWRYSAGVWTSFAPPAMPIAGTPAVEVFPELGGIVYQNGRNDGEIWLHKEGVWRKVAGGFATGEIHNVTIYSAKRKLLYFGGGDESGYYEGNQSVMMYALDPAGQVTRLPDAPVPVGVQTSVNTVDPATGNLLVFAKDRNIYEYDPDAKLWSRGATHNLLHRYGSFACGATPIAEHGVLMFVKFDYDASKVLVYKHSAGTPPPPPAPDGSEVTWPFNTDGDFEGWSPAQQIDAVAVSAGLLTGTASGSDPILEGPALAKSATLNKVVVNLRNDGAGATAQLFFSTAADGNWDEAKSLTIPIQPRSGFREYTFDLSNVPGWSGTVTRLRLDPTVVEGSFAIDWIRLGSRAGAAPDPAQSPEKSSSSACGALGLEALLVLASAALLGRNRRPQVAFPGSCGKT